MTRVERRMYRRRRARTRALWFAAAILLAGVAMAVRLAQKPPIQLERLGTATPTPAASAHDRNVVTREITLPEETWFTIQTGVFSAEDAAIEKADDYTPRGAPGTVIADGGKWRVFIASYGSETDATAVRQRLGEHQRVETYLYRWTCPELRLRLTGVASQLDVVEAGLSLMMTAAVQLRDMATLLDAAQLTTTEAVKALRELDGQISLWAQTARACFGRQLPDIIQRLLTTAERWTLRKNDMESCAKSATELSAALKGQGMQMFDEVTRMRTEIAAK